MTDQAAPPDQAMSPNSTASATTFAEGAVEVERDGPILRVWLNRPAQHNPLNTAVLDAIANIFTDVRTDFATRAVVLGGRGPSFSSGADRKASPGSERTSPTPTASDRERRYAGQIGRRACAAIADCDVPTIARVHGWSIGGGLALAVSCDFRIIIADDARFSIPEVDLGIPLAWGATPRLIAEIGAARARELILLCDVVDAEEAVRLGVAHRRVPPRRARRHGR